MNLKIVALALTLATVASHAKAGALNPAFPLLIRQYGVSEFYSPDQVLESTEPLNPARQLSVPTGTATGEVDYIGLKAGTMRTYWKVGSIMGNQGRTAWRLTYNNLSSNTGTLPPLAPMGATTSYSGDALEMVGAYRVSNILDVGLAYVPEDVSRMNLYAAGTPVAYGTSRSTSQGRVGAYLHHGQFALGGDAGWEKGDIDTTAFGSQVPRFGYTQDHTTYGIAWRPALGTTLCYSKQNNRLTSPDAGVRISTNTDYWGIDQWLSRSLDLRITRSGTSNVFSLTWLPSNKVSITLCDVRRAFSGSEDVTGKGDAFVACATYSL